MARIKATDTERESKRAQIISSAVRVFSRTGFHATKMQEIADEAGMGKGTLYEYFSTKDELFLAVYDSWMDKFEAQMQSAVKSHIDPVSKADALIDTAVEFYEEHADHASILMEFWAHALRAENPHFLERIRAMKKTLAALGAGVTKQMRSLGLFTEVDERSFALLELGISDGIFLQWVLDGKSYSLRDAYKFRQSVIGAGLMTTPLRKMLSGKTSKRLSEGFLKKPSAKSSNTSSSKTSSKSNTSNAKKS